MDADECLRAIRLRFPQIQVRTAVPIETGWSSFVLEINADTIFRFPRRPDLYASLEKEAVLLPYLAERLPVQTPQFKYLWRSRDEASPPFAGYPKIHGQPLDTELARAPQIAPQLAAGLGDFLTSLHQIKLPWRVHRQLPLGTVLDWKRKYLELYAWAQQQVFPLLSEPARAHAAGLWEGYLKPRANFRFEMALIHADLAPEHILCDPHSAALTGVIDWEDAVTGDPALDFAGLYQLGGPALVQRVLENYRLETGINFWPRLAFYHSITPYYEIQFAQLTQDDSRLQSGLRQLESQGGG